MSAEILGAKSMSAIILSAKSSNTIKLSAEILSAKILSAEILDAKIHSAKLHESRSRTWPRISSAPPMGCGLVMGVVWLSKGPLSDQIPILPSFAHGWY